MVIRQRVIFVVFAKARCSFLQQPPLVCVVSTTTTLELQFRSCVSSCKQWQMQGRGVGCSAELEPPVLDHIITVWPPAVALRNEKINDESIRDCLGTQNEVDYKYLLSF